MHEAVLLAGGKGTRLRPYTDHTPKVMLPIGGKPIMEYVLSYLVKNGYKDIAITIAKGQEVVEEYFGESYRGANLTYYYEEKPLNTAGAVKAIGEEALQENFLIMVADNLTNIDFKAFRDYHKEKEAVATIAAQPYTHMVQYGVLEEENGYVKAIREKPALHFTINAGFYYASRDLLSYIEIGEDFAKHVFPKVLREGGRLALYKANFLWFDVGTLAKYEFAKDVFDMLALFKAMLD